MAAEAAALENETLEEIGGSSEGLPSGFLGLAVRWQLTVKILCLDKQTKCDLCHVALGMYAADGQWTCAS